MMHNDTPKIHSAVQPDGQLAVPPRLRKSLPIGTLLSWQVNKNGTYTLTPAGDVGNDAWFWTPEWQEGEYEVDLEPEAGNYTVDQSAQEALDGLNPGIEEKTTENKPENSN